MTVPRELWPSIIRLAAPTLCELARLSTISRSTRALCWSPHDRYEFLKVNLADSRPVIDRFAADPSVLRNPRLFPDLPELLSLFFSDNDLHPGWCGYDGHDDTECLLIKICDEEDEQWVHACLERWPFEPNGGTRNATARRALTDRDLVTQRMLELASIDPMMQQHATMLQRVLLQRHGPVHWPPGNNKPLPFLEMHLGKASLCLLSRGRLRLLEKVIGDRGDPPWKALMDGDGLASIVKVARDPLPILKELFHASLQPEGRQHWQAIAVAVRRGLPHVVRYLGARVSPLESEMANVFPRALARRGPRPPYSPAGHDDHLYVDVETIAAVAEIGVRIHPRQFLDFMDRVCKEKGYPERIEDVPVMAALLEIREPVPLPPSWNAPWKLIDRPHLLQQLIDHGILLPDGVDQCLRSVADASHELGWEKMLDLAHRAVSLGASRANALLSSALEGDCVLMRLMLATKEDVKEAKDPEVVMHMVKSHRFTLEMCDLVIGAGYTVPGEAILVMVQKTYTRMDDNTRVAVLRRMLDAVEGDRAAFIAGPGLAIFTKVLFAAPRTVHGSLSPAVNEERVLEEVKALLDIGFRATASEIAMAKRGGLRETAALMEGFESAV